MNYCEEGCENENENNNENDNDCKNNYVSKNIYTEYAFQSYLEPIPWENLRAFTANPGIVYAVLLEIITDNECCYTAPLKC